MATKGEAGAIVAGPALAASSDRASASRTVASAGLRHPALVSVAGGADYRQLAWRAGAPLAAKSPSALDRSCCNHCGHRLGGTELVPLASFLGAVWKLPSLRWFDRLVLPCYRIRRTRHCRRRTLCEGEGARVGLTPLWAGRCFAWPRSMQTAAGAWLGLAALPDVVVCGALIGIAVALFTECRRRRSPSAQRWRWPIFWPDLPRKPKEIQNSRQVGLIRKIMARYHFLTRLVILNAHPGF